MEQNNELKLFEDKKIRAKWDEEKEKWYFSVVDIVSALTDNDYQAGRKYWKTLKMRTFFSYLPLTIYLTGIFFMYLKSMIVCLKITRMPSPVFFMPQISVIRMNPEKTTTKKTAVRSVL